jgi:hypothetical protein
VKREPIKKIKRRLNGDNTFDDEKYNMEKEFLGEFVLG